MRFAAGALARVAIFRPKEAGARAAAAPACLPCPADHHPEFLPVGIVFLGQVHARAKAEWCVGARLTIKPLAFAAYLPAALTLRLPRHEVFEVGMIVVTAAVGAPALHAQRNGVEHVADAAVAKGQRRHRRCNGPNP